MALPSMGKCRTIALQGGPESVKTSKSSPRLNPYWLIRSFIQSEDPLAVGRSRFTTPYIDAPKFGGELKGAQRELYAASGDWPETRRCRLRG
jgi:hypothetical protein